MTHPRIITTTGAIRWNWSVLVIFATFVIATFVNVSYTNQVQHQSQRRNEETLHKSQQVWCGLLIGIIKIPATNPASVKFHQQLQDIATTYGCRGVPQVPPKPVPTGRPGNSSPATTATPSG